MSYVITGNDFVFPYEIPLTKDMNAKAQQQLDAIIDERCRLLLRRVLGVANFVAFDAVLDPTTKVLPDPTTGIDPKWVDLVNGTYYDLEGVTYFWGGLKPLLVKYVYYYWLKQSVSYLSGVGVVHSEAKNASGVNATQEMAETWHSFISELQGSSFWGSPVGNRYHVGLPQYDGFYVGFPTLNTDASLYQYLYQFPDLYPETELHSMYDEGITNQLGI